MVSQQPRLVDHLGALGSLISSLPLADQWGRPTRSQGLILGGEDINAVYDRVVHSDVRYRFVIDTATFTA